MENDAEKVEQLRQMTINALAESSAGLEQFKELFEEISDAFESGEDFDGLGKIANIIDNLGDFASFCNSIEENSKLWLDAAKIKKMSEYRMRFQEHLTALLEESESGNFIEVGDIMRIDFCELFDDYLKLFPEIQKIIENNE